MPLAPVPTVPHVLAGDIPGLDGTRSLLVLPEPCDRLTLWVLGADMAAVQLDLAGVRALLGLLGEAEAAMRVVCGGISATTGADQALAADSASGAHL